MLGERELYISLNGPSPAGVSGLPIRYDAIWEFGFLEELVGRNNVILQADFDALLRVGEVRASKTCHAISLLYLLRRTRICTSSCFVFVFFRWHVLVLLFLVGTWRSD